MCETALRRPQGPPTIGQTAPSAAIREGSHEEAHFAAYVRARRSGAHRREFRARQPISRAFAATLEERIVAAAKPLGAADVSGMIWSPYFVPMQPVIAEFKKQTGIGVGGVQDISIFDAPQRAMAEALSRSPQFDFIHIDSNMIPSLASAGYLEPLDEYMKKADFKIDAVADYANFMTYKGQTYGVPTDGNVHIQYRAQGPGGGPRQQEALRRQARQGARSTRRPGRTSSRSSRPCMIRRRTSTARAACATAPTARPGGT